MLKKMGDCNNSRELLDFLIASILVVRTEEAIGNSLGEISYPTMVGRMEGLAGSTLDYVGIMRRIHGEDW